MAKSRGIPPRFKKGNKLQEVTKVQQSMNANQKTPQQQELDHLNSQLSQVEAQLHNDAVNRFNAKATFISDFVKKVALEKFPKTVPTEEAITVAEGLYDALVGYIDQTQKAAIENIKQTLIDNIDDASLQQLAKIQARKEELEDLLQEDSPTGEAA